MESLRQKRRITSGHLLSKIEDDDEWDFCIRLPIGIGIGTAFGASKDKKVFEERKQLFIAIKY